MSKIDGQIWIDKNSPYNLKYYYNNKEYVVNNTDSYEIDTSTEIFKNLKVNEIYAYAGTVVALGLTSDKKIKIEKAVFPEDTENIVGVLLNDVVKLDESSATRALISKSGYLEINYPGHIFREAENDILKNPESADIENLIGSNVYWYIGNMKKDENAYTYISSAEKGGFLSLHTPIDLSYNREDRSMNVAYENLPKLGTVVDYTLLGDEIQKLTVYLDFSEFSNSISWYWPALHNSSEEIGPTSKNNIQSSEEILIRHGLFGDSSDALNPKVSCDIFALEAHEDETDSESSEIVHSILAPITHKLKGNDKYTQITISSPEKLIYRIKGTVDYNFDKGGN